TSGIVCTSPPRTNGFHAGSGARRGSRSPCGDWNMSATPPCPSPPVVLLFDSPLVLPPDSLAFWSTVLTALCTFQTIKAQDPIPSAARIARTASTIRTVLTAPPALAGGAVPGGALPGPPTAGAALIILAG